MNGSELEVIARMLVSLVVVAGLAVVLLRFGLPRLGVLAGATTRLETLEVRALDRQHKIALVRARGEEILLGLGAGEITLLRAWQSLDERVSGASSDADEVRAGAPRPDLEREVA
ncbi:MAG: flagellar biosynthetic protein FliO [Acidobacteriota bacterium]